MCAISFKRQAEAVYTVTQTGRGRAVVKDMPQVPATLTAQDFRPNHAVREVPFLRYDAVANLLVKAWPAAVRIELAFRREQRGATARTAVGTRFEVLVVFARAWVFSSFLTQDSVAFWA